MLSIKTYILCTAYLFIINLNQCQYTDNMREVQTSRKRAFTIILMVCYHFIEHGDILVFSSFLTDINVCYWIKPKIEISIRSKIFIFDFWKQLVTWKIDNLLYKIWFKILFCITYLGYIVINVTMLFNKHLNSTFMQFYDVWSLFNCHYLCYPESMFNNISGSQK